MKRIDNTMSGLRQRARHNNVKLVATFSEVATLIKAQQYRCGLTGVLLSPDRKSELAHKMPASKGGGYDIGNLIWITYEMNRMMGAMEFEEFIGKCRRVSGWVARTEC